MVCKQEMENLSDEKKKEAVESICVSGRKQ